MKRGTECRSKCKPILLTIAATLLVIFVFLPIVFSVFGNSRSGNVALIPINGPLTADGSSDLLGTSSVSSAQMVDFINEADSNSEVKVIMLEINSPGGSAVASDEIASAVKKAKKPVVALIREVGASGGYWVASAADYVIANRMSITGSIGVISSYLEFSGLMEKYGVSYEQLISGDKKDIGTPYRKLTEEERALLQAKLDKVHQFFIEEIAANRKLDSSKVERLATGEFYLGEEAYDLGLIDQLGDKDTAEEYIKTKYGLEEVEFAVYEEKKSFLELLQGVFSDWSFSAGQGFASFLTQKDNRLMLMW